MGSDIQTIRLLVGDSRKRAINEVVGMGDGVSKNFKLSMFPLASAPTAVLTITISGVAVASTNYNITGSFGALTFLSAPTANAEILGSYDYFALTSGELSDLLSGHTGSPFLVASHAALALAGQSSKFFAYTMGEKTVDKRKIASDLRELSSDLMDRHRDGIKDGSYNAAILTLKDNSGTPYHNFDKAEQILHTSGVL